MICLWRPSAPRVSGHDQRIPWRLAGQGDATGPLYTGGMDSSPQRRGDSSAFRRGRRPAAGHRHVLRRTAPPSATMRSARHIAVRRDSSPDGGAWSPAYPRLSALRRLRVALRVATVQRRQLQQLVDEGKRQRDLALADAAELRIRCARLSARLYTLEAQRRPPEVIVVDPPEPVGPPPPAPTVAVPGSPRAPWYRRFWFALIGKDVRAAEWSASPRLP